MEHGILFDEWLKACRKMKGLSAFVQNDLDGLLKDGYITIEEIRKSIVEFEEFYCQNKKEQEEIFDKIRNYLILKTTKE